mgnify:FL=1
MIKRFAGEGFNLFNPFTYHNLGKAIEKTRSGDPNVEYSKGPAGDYGKAINERNQMLKRLEEQGLL